ncbi:MAG TPA: hypothetical protein VFP55_07360 [Solirubrobacteraceae bacterium]|nr:hypothetical protein [Solirubrobacteraceae bacterium]
MKIRSKATALIAASGALAIAVPAAAHTTPSHPSGTGSGAAHTHRCAPHKVAYIVSGTIIDGSTLVQASDGTWSGTLTYTVTHHNRWAKGDSGSATLSSTKVSFRAGATDFSAGNRVKLIGKVEYVRVKGHNSCTNPGAQGAPTFRKAIVLPPAS